VSTTVQGDRSDILSVEELGTLVFLTEYALPTVLDTVVAVAQGKIDLKKVVPAAPKSWASFFYCMAASAVQVAVTDGEGSGDTCTCSFISGSRRRL
jgi:hypothetical protein